MYIYDELGAPFWDDQQEAGKMDFFNNELGRQIALEYAGQGYDVFADEIMKAIEEGRAYVIEWDE